MMTRRDIIRTLGALGIGSVGTVLGGCQHLDVASPKPRFQVAGNKFMLDGSPFQMRAGEMHYPRIPRALWRDRMRKLKSLGLNTLSTYIFWNAHEKTPGQFDFSGNLDISAFLRLARKEGLWVNLRPGPYSCAEWDNGGFPSWLFPDDSIPARSTDPRFLGPAEHWLKRLGQEITPLMISRGGPIILTQVENEYGSYGSDHSYMRAIHRILQKAGFDGIFYTADGAAVMQGGILPGLIPAINFGTYAQAQAEFAKRLEIRPDGPLICGELWSGWFDHFGETHANMPIEPLLESLKWMLDNQCSFSFYMLHGGTSFGFSAGANFQPDSHFAPDISSYDYDAILDEAGRPTAKYHAVKKLFQKYIPSKNFPPLPNPEKAIHIPRFKLTESAPLHQLASQAIPAEEPQTLEALGHTHGLMLYSSRQELTLTGRLSIGDVRDYALIKLDGAHGSNRVGTLDRRFAETSLDYHNTHQGRLEILVDVMGRVNYGKWVGKDQKGLIGPVLIDDKPVKGWDHIAFPLDDLSKLRFDNTMVKGAVVKGAVVKGAVVKGAVVKGAVVKGATVKGPAFYRGKFTLSERGYTFLDMRGWGKGYVWVNGHNLGRYWSVGPQRSLFVPAPWLKTGINEVIVFDLQEDAGRALSGVQNPIWDIASNV